MLIGILSEKKLQWYVRMPYTFQPIFPPYYMAPSLPQPYPSSSPHPAPLSIYQTTSYVSNEAISTFSFCMTGRTQLM